MLVKPGHPLKWGDKPGMWCSPRWLTPLHHLKTPGPRLLHAAMQELRRAVTEWLKV